AGRTGVGPGHDRRVHGARVGDLGEWRGRVPPGPGAIGLVVDMVAVGPEGIDATRGVNRGHREDPVVARADRTMEDLEVAPGDHRRRGVAGHRADRLVDPVEVNGRGDALVQVVGCY